MSPITIALSPIDEMFIQLEDPVRPLTVQLEVRVKGQLDESRLRNALQAAVRRHHLARARLQPWRSDATTYTWVIDEEPQIDPLRVTDSCAAGHLDALRSDFYSRSISLSESPPFRALLVHDPSGDLVMLSVNHTACDGIGALRLMQSIGRAYAGVPDPTVEMDPGEALRLAIPPDGPAFGERVDAARLGVQQLVQMRSRPANVAAKDPSPEPGYGVHTMMLPVAPLTASALRRRLGATVNDVLLAAVHRSIDEWNRQHGKRPGRVTIPMPVNARLEAWRYEVVGNLIASESVSTSKRQRETPEACLTAVAGWTEAVKRRGTGAAVAAQAKGWGGRVTQRRAFGSVVRVIAGFLGGTAALSNLGRVPPDWIDSGGFEVREIWVSPPTVGTALAIGAVSVNDTLHLSLRYSRAVLSRDAAAAFAEVLRSELDTLSGAT